VQFIDTDGTQFIDTDDNNAKLQVTDVYHCRFSGCKKLVLCCDIVPVIADCARLREWSLLFSPNFLAT
jgi:hypothetical protein